MQHFYTYSPLDPWAEINAAEVAERRLICHALVDLMPNSELTELMEKLANSLIAWRIHERDYDLPPVQVGARSARFLRSLFSARIPAQSLFDDEVAEP